jgi:hypothetical protein
MLLIGAVSCAPHVPEILLRPDPACAPIAARLEHPDAATRVEVRACSSRLLSVTYVVPVEGSITDLTERADELARDAWEAGHRTAARVQVGIQQADFEVMQCFATEPWKALQSCI